MMNFASKIWVTSFVISIFLLSAVFDTLFKSPILIVSKKFSAANGTPIKRVIFIVADGLRGDIFFDYKKLHPYLTSLMESRELVTWGISKTKVPTESRPGHVALFGGIYEDPSAIFSGWKQNLVPFETVFDFTNYSILLGSPDIVNMFRKKQKQQVYVESYPSDWQDFLADNSSVLDIWVLEKFKLLLEKNAIPHNDKGLIFLHLLGIDNTGHACKPKSEEYFSNIQIVDSIIQEVQSAAGSYFRDNGTLFIFTSDHGMTDTGSHGSGSEVETHTPYVVWGPGVAWESNELLRTLSQVDFAPLVACALRTYFPSNSLGRSPVIWNDTGYSFDCLVANFYQLKELVDAKRDYLKNRMFSVRPFGHESVIELLFNKSLDLNSTLKQVEAIHLIQKSLSFLLRASTYYERYDQALLLSLCVSSCCIWLFIIGLSSSIIHNRTQAQLFFANFIAPAFVIAIVLAKGFFDWPWFRVAYIFVPLYLLRVLKSFWMASNSIELNTTLTPVLFGICATEVLVISFYYREILNIGLIFGLLLIVVSKKQPKEICGLWMLSFVLLGIFPALPTKVFHNSYSYLMSGGPLCAGLTVQWLAWKNVLKLSQKDLAIITVQSCLICLVSVVIHYPEWILTRALSWSSLILIVLPKFLSSRRVFIKLLSVFIALNTPLSLLSNSCESMFLSSLFLVLLCLLKQELSHPSEAWMQFLNTTLDGLNQELGNQNSDALKTLLISWLHLFFMIFSFFGTGNIASISSFNPSNVRCFLSIFNPYVMMVLLVMKILIPFILVASVFRALVWRKRELEKHFILVLLLSQAVSLQLFLDVQNEGSWLEIGTSISRFAIAQLSTLFLPILHFLSGIMMSKGGELISFSTKIE